MRRDSNKREKQREGKQKKAKTRTKMDQDLDKAENLYIPKKNLKKSKMRSKKP